MDINKVYLGDCLEIMPSIGDKSIDMIINRIWAMPNKWTFQIKPIAELLTRYVGDGKGWIDPFAGENSPAEITNDLNPNRIANYHLEAKEFLNRMNGENARKFNGILFDPPYSLRQVKELYDSIGKPTTGLELNFGDLRGIIQRIIAPGGMAISFGWNSIGIGKTNGFEIIEILLVCHGGSHNDTIVTVERKIQSELVS